MKEIFQAYATYNARTNDIILGLMGGMGQEALCHDYGAYFHSLTEVMLHTMASDAKWLGRMAAFRETPGQAALASEAESFKQALKADPAFAFIERERIADLRRRLDAEIKSTIEAIDEEALAGDFEIAFGPGRLRLPLWKLLLQWFNHHTHHRGQVSAMLDMAGVEHDFSLIIDKC
jgi:uncharacterized damage-inducible protein DinB